MAESELLTAPYLTVAEAAKLARISTKRLRNLMADGTLVEGIHYTRPRKLRPRVRREALIDWLEGRDDGADECVRVRRSKQGSKLNLSLLK